MRDLREDIEYVERLLKQVEELKRQSDLASSTLTKAMASMQDFLKGGMSCGDPMQDYLWVAFGQDALNQERQDAFRELDAAVKGHAGEFVLTVVSYNTCFDSPWYTGETEGCANYSSTKTAYLGQLEEGGLKYDLEEPSWAFPTRCHVSTNNFPSPDTLTSLIDGRLKAFDKEPYNRQQRDKQEEAPKVKTSTVFEYVIGNEKLDDWIVSHAATAEETAARIFRFASRLGLDVLSLDKAMVHVETYREKLLISLEDLRRDRRAAIDRLENNSLNNGELHEYAEKLYHTKNQLRHGIKLAIEMGLGEHELVRYLKKKHDLA